MMLLKVRFRILADLEDRMLLPQSEFEKITEVLASEKACRVSRAWLDYDGSRAIYEEVTQQMLMKERTENSQVT